jgi:flagellar protein FlaF
MALMTAHAFNAKSVYGTTGREIGGDRNVEVQVFQKAMASLRPLIGLDFQLTPDAAKALSENLKLWDALTVDLVHPDNQLEKTLAAQLIELGRFVRFHTHGLYAGTGTVDVLVDINSAVLQGLMGRPGEGANTSHAA